MTAAHLRWISVTNGICSSLRRGFPRVSDQTGTKFVAAPRQTPVERLRRKPAPPLLLSAAASTVTPRSLCVPGESAAVGALLQYWITDILPAHGGEEAELPQVPPGGRQSR